MVLHVNGYMADCFVGETQQVLGTADFQKVLLQAQDQFAYVNRVFLANHMVCRGLVRTKNDMQVFDVYVAKQR